MIRSICPCLSLLIVSLFLPLSAGASDLVAPGLRLSIQGKAGNSAQAAEIDPFQESSLTAVDGRVSLTLLDAVRYALEGNRSVEIAAYYPRQAEQDYKSLAAVYDPALFALWSKSKVDRPTQSQLDTGLLVDEGLEEERWLARLGVKSLLATGGNLSLFQEVDHLDSNSTLIYPNPQSTSRMTVQLTQPLLKGLGDLENQTAIESARLNISILNQDYRQTVMDVVANVCLTYWQLDFQRRIIAVAERYRLQTEDLLERERNRLKRGLAKELDVNRIRANLDSRRNELISLRKQLRSYQNDLLRLLNGSGFYQAREVETLDSPAYADSLPEAESLESQALQNRPEIERARKELRTVELKRKLADRNTWPTLDFQASYSKNSLSDNSLEARADVYESTKESWSVGVNFEMPIGNRAANAALRSAEFEYRRKVSELRAVEESILYEVNQALSDLQAAKAEVEAARAAVGTAKAVLDGELALFDLLRADSSDLLQAQSQLDNAERKVVQSLTNFSRARVVVQRSSGHLLTALGIRIEDRVN